MIAPKELRNCPVCQLQMIRHPNTNRPWCKDADRHEDERNKRNALARTERERLKRAVKKSAPVN